VAPLDSRGVDLLAAACSQNKFSRYELRRRMYRRPTNKWNNWHWSYFVLCISWAGSEQCSLRCLLCCVR